MSLILYFIEGSSPTNDEFENAQKIDKPESAFLEFISLENIDLNKQLIAAAGVAGKVPAVYKDYKKFEIKQVAKPLEVAKNQPTANAQTVGKIEE